MSVVAAAVVGSAVVGGYVSSRASSKAARATKRASDSAAQATIESTAMQIDEIRRQFDYQSELLLPLIQQQYVGGAAFSGLLGLGPALQAGITASNQPTEEQQSWELAQRTRDPNIIYDKHGRALRRRRKEVPDPLAKYRGDAPRPLSTPEYPSYITGRNYIDDSGLPVGSQGTGIVPADNQNYFIDPNLNPAGYESTQQLQQHITDNQLAGPVLEDDVLYQNIEGRRLAEGAAGENVYGETFTESPGYQFQVDEMNRALDYRNSAGGNYGGEALREAARYAQGVAAQDYYNWARGRTTDLTRLAAAESQDAGRLDSAAVDYMGRESRDIARSDLAVSEADRLRGLDVQRDDQAYYNYLANLSQMAGFGNATGQAVSSSQAAGSQVANAYANQGNQLSSNYLMQGQNQANIAMNNAANINNAIQSGVSGLVMHNYLNQPQTTAPSDLFF